MSCKEIQQEILDLLAAEERSLPTKLLAHRRSCVECRSYYESQVLMFHSIDQGLGAIANAPVPPSLLPGVRVRLDEPVGTRVFPFHGWTLAALATTALAVVAFIFFWHRSTQSNNAVPEVARATAPQTIEPKQDTPPAPEPAKHAETRPTARKRPFESKLSPVEPQEEPAPEVLVLAEEREAFARFIAQAPENPQAAFALTRPLPEVGESAVEIALLVIKPVEVKPLESSEE